VGVEKPIDKSGRFDLDRVLLKFKDAEVERDFSQWSFATSIHYVRAFLFGAIILYSAFGLLDAQIGGEHVTFLWFVRYAVVVPCIALILALSFTASFQRYLQVSLLTSALFCGLGVIAMVTVLPQAEASRYYAGLIMVVIYCGGMLGYSYLYGCVSTLVILTSYQLVSLFVNPIPAVDFVSNNFFLVMSCGVGIVCNYMLEMHSRDHYVDQKIIQEKSEAMQVLLDRAEAANRAKSEFLTNMSHELRTPLNAIIGFSEIIRKEHLGPVGSAKYMEYATDIHDSGRHLLTIINDILDLARAEAGKLVIREQVFDMSGLVGSICAQLGPQALEAGLEMKIEALQPSVSCRGDQRLLRQVLLNVVSNAIKFTPPGGHVSVSLAANEDQGILIEVVDTGVGIPPGDLERVLRPFEQVERALTRSHAGAGLGLPYAVKIMELHEGRLAIRSAVGAGSTVTITLPGSRFLETLDDDGEIRVLDLA
jgi:nitrogen-specific signal transduction histidine kinase